MSFPFDAQQGLIVVPVQCFGPTGEALVRLALDTGATCTLISVDLLVALGYNPAQARERIEVTTGSGVESVGRIES